MARGVTDLVAGVFAVLYAIVPSVEPPNFTGGQICPLDIGCVCDDTLEYACWECPEIWTRCIDPIPPAPPNLSSCEGPTKMCVSAHCSPQYVDSCYCPP